ncbi:MAG: UDP-glucose/GDP-mannose dehydrogenase family protein [Bacteroidetes bacterium]|jgi:UDPglucose 6-dehydrogenase|nr:UDP-glucose/GDP-mannose dehydrogenase family protein [Bacteroidota bacterium]MBT4398457.1 UDP-glucose/GDP-mannose dehydrogenase family protein [Bacteroidota bacterium]MBT4411946.1 UDP-glucose/GDP-mannose dehydrogenase family protein [Bacteroidota bacterium]MBT5427762.1 UDP-glucose/GDP-mannose dehydrogenase family protein [Bacteroidota bacterium]MBT7095153.1 UDP-glucose/GDP-mannose dehydrogenase family protein [Bacteroidota bacterium]
MRISIVGTGYVGLVTGACFAEAGINVTCVDIDQKKIDMLNNGKVPIWEPGLDDMIQRNVAKGRLVFTTNIKDNLDEAEAVFIAVGTPPDEDGSADLKYVLAVARDIGKYMSDYLVVVTKSTVPIGTSLKVRDAVKETLGARNSDLDFDVASNPEFLKEGSAIADFMKPDRIVVGVSTSKAEKVMKRLYKPFLLNGHPILFMDIPSAELTKYTANSMLATKISFMNDIANLCEIVGADVDMVRKGIGSDTRIGHKFIYPGVGYGGSCFPKDVKALIKTAGENNYDLRVLQAVEEVNYTQKQVLFGKINTHFKQNLAGKKFAMWGLAFKPNTDDMREAPALVVIDQLVEAGASVVAYDPVAVEETKRRIGDKITYVDDPYEALIDADALLLLTEWSEFRIPRYRIMEKLLKNKLVFDGRNVFDPVEMKEFGYTYYGIGR